MGISYRHGLFAEDGSPRRLPQRIVDELPTGRHAIPEFAGTRQRVACVVLEHAEGRPQRILDARGDYWTFDDEGRVDKDMNRRMIEIIERIAEPPAARRGPVVDLSCGRCPKGACPPSTKPCGISLNEVKARSDAIDKLLLPTLAYVGCNCSINRVASVWEKTLKVYCRRVTLTL